MYAFLLLCINISFAQIDSTVLLREDFNDLLNWKDIYVAAKKPRTKYQILNDGDNNLLKIHSNKSASGLLFDIVFNPHEHPILRWRWKVDSVIENADGRQKSGDDYPVRIFILFAYDHANISFWQKLKNIAFKFTYGYEPPQSGLIFVWANMTQDSEFFESPYNKNLIIWNIRQGNEETNRWFNEEINIIEYYKTAFGKLPPKQTSLAIMGDSDNTGEISTAFIDYIEIAY